MKRVGVLRGGVSGEYDLSIQTGAHVRRALHDAGYDAIDMLLDKEGVLHVKGIPTDPSSLKNHVDVVWNALHGQFGEDGQIQSLLDAHNIPYTGANAEAASLAWNKLKAKEKARELGIKTPHAMLILPTGDESVSEITQRIYHTMAPPWVVKPLEGGGSLRTHFAFTPLELAEIVSECVGHARPFLAEQYVYGTEAAVGVIDGFRGKEHYTLPVTEVRSPRHGVLTHDMRRAPHAVYNGSLRSDDREQVAVLARKLHQALGVKDYSQSEFIVDSKGAIWFTELDSHPHLHEHAPFMVALEAVGASLQEFVQSVLRK